MNKLIVSHIAFCVSCFVEYARDVPPKRNKVDRVDGLFYSFALNECFEYTSELRCRFALPLCVAALRCRFALPLCVAAGVRFGFLYEE